MERAACSSTPAWAWAAPSWFQRDLFGRGVSGPDDHRQQHPQPADAAGTRRHGIDFGPTWQPQYWPVRSRALRGRYDFASNFTGDSIMISACSTPSDAHAHRPPRCPCPPCLPPSLPRLLPTMAAVPARRPRASVRSGRRQLPQPAARRPRLRSQRAASAPRRPCPAPPRQPADARADGRGTLSRRYFSLGRVAWC